MFSLNRVRVLGSDLLALSTIFPSVISSFFTQNKGGGGPPLDPPLHMNVVPRSTINTNGETEN